MEKFFNLAETSQLLKISRTTLRKIVNAGLIKTESVGKRLIISESTIEEFRNQMTKNMGIPQEIADKIFQKDK
jgi:predicted site-specific integrase-resolvase